jgi:hypothetical protein
MDRSSSPQPVNSFSVTSDRRSISVQFLHVNDFAWESIVRSKQVE